jgi:DNA mismatch repair ATPase MutS
MADNREKSIAQRITKLKGKYKGGLLFIATDDGFSAFYDDAMIANLLCAFPIKREIVKGELVSRVNVSFSKLERQIPKMLRAGYKVIVYGSKMQTIYEEKKLLEMSKRL